MSRDIIKKLLKKYEVKDILTDEVRFDFNSLKKPNEVYGVPQNMPKGYQEGPFDHYWDENAPSSGPDPKLINLQNGQ